MVNAVNLFMTCYDTHSISFNQTGEKMEKRETARICQLVTLGFEWWRRARKLAGGASRVCVCAHWEGDVFDMKERNWHHRIIASSLIYYIFCVRVKELAFDDRAREAKRVDSHSEQWMDNYLHGGEWLMII